MVKLVLNILAYLLVVIVNFLANALPLNGQTTGEISDKVQVLFTPAGYVFSIWGLIYLLLGLWVLRQFPKSRRNLPLYQSTSVWFVLSCLLNSTWIFLWHYNYFTLSVVIMISLLLTLIALYGNAKRSDPSFLDIAPFSLYLGWISVATIANISFTLEFYEWSGWGLSDITWTIILLFTGTILAIFFTTREKDWLYPLVFVWAFIGIGVKNQDLEPAITTTAYGLAVTTLILSLLIYFRKR
ncbi:TspO/MBR family protein [Bacillus sp. 2205SS5-2]|uniref:TspO/MBR family protein n=1 Tax=Bacillus sp. 2205SS5-2 TaxID=3109031 RepID=UPI003003CCB5